MFTDQQLELLRQPLDPNRVKTRKGRSDDGKAELSYLAGHDVIDEANLIFGFGNWGITDWELVRYTEETREIKGRTRYDVFVIVKVVMDVVDRESGAHSATVDVGFGAGQSYSSFGEAQEKAFKEAVTDGMKRCLRIYGNQFGNSLYDQEDQYGTEHAAQLDAVANGKNPNDPAEKLIQHDTLIAIKQTCRERGISLGETSDYAKKRFGRMVMELKEGEAQEVLAWLQSQEPAREATIN